MRTFDTLTAIKVSSAIDAVINGKSLAPFITQIHDGRLRVTGGELRKAGDWFYLVFGQLFGSHAQAVYAFCARRTADLSLAEDLTSITFLEAWRHRDRVPPAQGGGALPWLLGVANNVVRNARRGQRRRLSPRMPVGPRRDLVDGEVALSFSYRRRDKTAAHEASVADWPSTVQAEKIIKI